MPHEPRQVPSWRNFDVRQPTRMNIKRYTSPLLASVLFAIGFSADLPKVELRAESLKSEGSKMIAKGSAVAIAGEAIISAEHIIFDRESGEVRCIGDAVIRVAHLTISTKDPKIDTKPPRSPTTPLSPREIRDLPSPNVRF